ncbi:MAG TPA: hypothetical protein VFQ39_07615 [Longimicrobium sp.]|nr:hypothetical protein [Longimicrobium sp.]
MLIDDFMPRWEVDERHATLVHADAARAWQAVRTLDLSRSPVVRALFALRSLPALLAGKRRRGRALGATLDDLLRGGFVLLAERQGEEIVLGLAGKFWRPGGGIVRVEPGGFRDFGAPGLAVAAWNFVLAPEAGGVRVTTETRVRCTDEASRRAFRRYWRVVGPFSALTRVEMLRAVRAAAEAPTSAAA